LVIVPKLDAGVSVAVPTRFGVRARRPRIPFHRGRSKIERRRPTRFGVVEHGDALRKRKRGRELEDTDHHEERPREQPAEHDTDPTRTAEGRSSGCD
jgi:hypothetical protein